MTKQEEVRNGVKGILTSDLSIHVINGANDPGFSEAFDNAWNVRVEEVLNYLHDNDVVIKNPDDVLTLDEMVMYGEVLPLIESASPES